MRLDQLSWQIPTSVSSKTTHNTHYPHIHCVACLSPQSKVHSVSYRLCSSLLLLRSHQTKQVIWNIQWFKMTKRFHCIKWPRCAGFLHNSHNSMTQTMSQPPHTIVWKRKQNTQSIEHFPQHDYHVYRKVKRLAQGYMDWKDTGTISKAEERK